MSNQVLLYGLAKSHYTTNLQTRIEQGTETDYGYEAEDSVWTRSIWFKSGLRLYDADGILISIHLIVA